MSDYVQKLESYQNLEGSIIRKTKINKVLKGIMKLASIPKDEEFNLRERSKVLLQAWSQVLANEPEGASDDNAADKDGGANGNKKSDESDAENVHETAVDNAKEAQVEQGEHIPETGPEIEMEHAEHDETELTGTAEEEAGPTKDKVKLVEAVETTMTTMTTEAELQHDESTGKTSKPSSFPISVSAEEVTTTLMTRSLAS